MPRPIVHLLTGVAGGALVYLACLALWKAVAP
jgi:hypothetical protein